MREASDRIVEEAMTTDPSVARTRVMDAIVAHDSAALVEALSLYGAVSWRQGWDAAVEELGVLPKATA